jgi:N-acetyltransferase
MMTDHWIQSVCLVGTHATLEPLSLSHEGGLKAAVMDGELWKLWYTTIPSPEGMGDEIVRRLQLQAQGRMVPFAVLDAQQKIVGMTTYMNIDATHRRVEIGSTWTALSAQRGPINTECKRMLLQHAFEGLDCIAVEFRTHFFNQQSRRAIERLGAKLDGVLRHHQQMKNGTLRDTCVYSITAIEWPAVRAHLQWQLEKPR